MKIFAYIMTVSVLLSSVTVYGSYCLENTAPPIEWPLFRKLPLELRQHIITLAFKLKLGYEFIPNEMFYQSPDKVSVLALSLDGCSMVTASNIVHMNEEDHFISNQECIVNLWEISDMRGFLRQLDKVDILYQVTFNPQGTLILAGILYRGVNMGRIWDVETGEQVHQIRHSSRVGSVDFNADGSWFLTGCWDGFVRVGDTKTGKIIYTLSHPAWVSCATFSPDGATVFSGSGSSVKWDKGILPCYFYVWDLQNGKRIAVLEGDYSFKLLADSFSAKHSRNGSFICAQSDRCMYVWDRDSFNLHIKREEQGGCSFVGFDAEGEFFLTIKGNSLYIHEVSSGMILMRLSHVNPICSAAISNDGSTIVCGDVQGYIQLWHRGPCSWSSKAAYAKELFKTWYPLLSDSDYWRQDTSGESQPVIETTLPHEEKPFVAELVLSTLNKVFSSLPCYSFPTQYYRELI